jgi:hypothetical protein
MGDDAPGLHGRIHHGDVACRRAPVDLFRERVDLVRSGVDLVRSGSTSFGAGSHLLRSGVDLLRSGVDLFEAGPPVGRLRRKPTPGRASSRLGGVGEITRHRRGWRLTSLAGAVVLCAARWAGGPSRPMRRRRRRAAMACVSPQASATPRRRGRSCGRELPGCIPTGHPGSCGCRIVEATARAHFGGWELVAPPDFNHDGGVPLNVAAARWAGHLRSTGPARAGHEAGAHPPPCRTATLQAAIASD